VPIRNLTPEDDQPLARPVQEQSLARSAGGEQEEATQAESQQAGEEQTATQAEATHQGEKGPVTRVVDKAQENNWVYGSVAEKARETGLLDKADKLLSKARNRLGSA
jgi:hypothetical protein